MAPARYNERVLAIIMQDIEKNKGKNSIFLVNNTAACVAQAKEIQKVTRKVYNFRQLKDKHRHLARSFGQNCRAEDLYLKGFNCVPRQQQGKYRHADRLLKGTEGPIEVQEPTAASTETLSKSSGGTRLLRSTQDGRIPAIAPVSLNSSVLPMTPTLMELERLYRRRQLLVHDLDSLKPQRNELNQLRNDIVRAVDRTVHNLSRQNIQIHENSHSCRIYPRQRKVQIVFEGKSDQFVGLCRRIFGKASEYELYECIGHLGVDFEDFLQGLIAAAVNDWVLELRRVSLQEIMRKETRIPEFLDSQIREIFPEFVPQLLLKTQRDFIMQRLEHEGTVGRLAQQFESLATQFMEDNGFKSFRQAFSDWLGDLHTIFGLALKFRALWTLTEEDLDIRWPTAGTPYSIRDMKCDGFVNVSTRQRVKIPLFPSIHQCQTLSEGVGDGTVLVKAQVML